MNELGYFITDAFSPNYIMGIRQQFLSLFECKSDAEVIELYKTNKARWVKAYDQLRYLPEIYALAGNSRTLSMAYAAGIKHPAIGAKLVVRADMPNDDEWSFPPHQDAPYNPGSRNRITVWVPFQDTEIAEGALKIIPGVHWYTELPQEKNLLVTPPIDEDYISVPVKLGQALVFSQFLIHKSGPNRSNTIRFSLQARYNDLEELVHRSNQ